MKNLIILLTLSFCFIAISCNSSSNEEKVQDDCRKQLNYVNDTFKRCKPSEETVKSFLDSRAGGCDVYSEKFSDNHETCKENLLTVSCDDVNKFMTVDDVDESLGCFDFPKFKKEEACVTNVVSYCSQYIFKECAYDKLPEYCHKTGTTKDDEAKLWLNVNTEKIKNYCSSTISGNNDMFNDDFFHKTCHNYQVDCNNIEEIDFRNDNWKTECSQE